MKRLIIIFIAFYAITCLVAYSNGERDGRIQRRRVDAEDWVNYIDKNDEFLACARKVVYAYDTDLAVRVKRSCGMPPIQPEAH